MRESANEGFVLMAKLADTQHKILCQPEITQAIVERRRGRMLWAVIPRPILQKLGSAVEEVEEITNGFDDVILRLIKVRKSVRSGNYAILVVLLSNPILFPIYHGSASVHDRHSLNGSRDLRQ
ncbi:hypothetical protein HOY82DRAFT_595919 [Tuber indicum]|nr:hypothetical protein HOY82DRAFT_595919 [Tuber indicum]